MSRTIRKEYRNPNAGKKCGGRCEKCGRNADFLIHCMGVFCSECKDQWQDRIGKKAHKYFLKKSNLFNTEWCTLCRKRDKDMWSVNFSFCKGCLARLGLKNNKVSVMAENEKSIDNLKKFERKVKLKQIDESDIEERIREARKQRRRKLFKG